MDVYISTVDRNEHEERWEPGKVKVSWSVYLVSTIDEAETLTLWGTLNTDDPEVGETFKVGSHWKLVPAE